MGEVYWITGLSGAGKTTIGRLFYERLKREQPNTVFLDGDAMRQVFGDDLGYTREERVKCAMRYARLCEMLQKQDLNVVCCTISMFDDVRDWNRSHIENYREIYVRVSMETLKKRDQKGLYSGAGKEAGCEVAGVQFAVEEPRCPDLVLENDGDFTPGEQVERIMLLRQQPLISVIIPVYNVEKELPRCIESVLGQTYKNMEILLVDDGSSDGSGEICDAYADRYERVSVIHKRNGGPMSARKAGLHRAKGPYIGFVDSDDYIEETMYELLIGRLLETDADFVHAGYFKEYGDTKSCICEFVDGGLFLPDDRISFLEENVLRDGGPYEMPPSLCTKLFKESVIKKCLSMVKESQEYGEDLICTCACCLESERIAFLKKPLYHYIVRENSISTSVSMFNLVREFYLYQCMNEVFSAYGCRELAAPVMDRFLKSQVVYALSTLGEERVYVQRFQFAGADTLAGKTGVIYGAGQVGIDYYKQLSCMPDCALLGVIDSQPDRYAYDFIEVKGPDALLDMRPDYILIAVSSSSTAEIIKKSLTDMGFDEQIMLWERPTAIV